VGKSKMETHVNNSNLTGLDPEGNGDQTVEVKFRRRVRTTRKFKGSDY
jgi:hypothetical protein